MVRRALRKWNSNTKDSEISPASTKEAKITNIINPAITSETAFFKPYSNLDISNSVDCKA